MEETFGRYRLLEPLGRGGMAEVFKAKSFGVEGFEKILVIKRILPELASNPAFVQMFVHEAKLAVRLSHANIVQVFDLGKVDNLETATSSYFMAMEYVAGMDLATLLVRARRRGISLPVELSVFVASEIAKGLDHAHRRRDEQMRPLGIVHRDVSPQNVLLSWEGEVKVTDFGIAKARDIVDDRPEATRTGTLKGKYAYMSPEQARGRPVDARSDIFSLGTVLYELLAGVNPFSSASSVEMIRRVQAAEYPPLELLRQDLAAELIAIVRKALGKEPHERFENAGRLYEELLAYMYSSSMRFTANDLGEFLVPYREGESLSVEGSRVLQDLGPFDDKEPERTPIEVPIASVDMRSEQHSSAEGRVKLVDGAAGLGERREVTALVLCLGERNSPLAEPLRARIKDTLGRYGGRLIDEEPTQLVSLFGLGESDGRDTETAVRCALVLLRQLGSGKSAPSAGVHTGRVLVHASGEPARDERLASVVREAQGLSRLIDGTCALSSSAAREVKSLFVLEPVPDDARAPVAPGALLAKDVRAPEEAWGKFIGRKVPLRRMGEILAIATRRHLRVITIVGEQGVGKTRLLYEVQRRLRKGQYNVGCYVASCPPRGKEAPLAGLTAMLEVLCGVREGDPMGRVMAVEPRLRALGLFDEERQAVLGHLGAQNWAPSGPNLPPLRAAFARMVQSLCEDRLQLFAWDNAHALDSETLDVLSNVAPRLTATRAAFLLSMRTPLEMARFDPDILQSIELGPLDEPETAQLVALRAGLREAPPELVSFCQQRAGGHPLYLEELVKELVETGALSVRAGRVQALRLTDDVMAPKPLRSLLIGRVARLEPQLKAIVYAACVLGDPVDSAVLAAMLGISVQQVDRSIAELEKRGLLRREGASTSVLATPFLREAVLESLPVSGKKELHGAAAAAYQSVLRGQLELKAHQVATHLYECGDRHRAADFYALSGKQKLRTGQLQASVHDLLRALELSDLQLRTPEELCDWLQDLHTAVHTVRSAPSLPDIAARIVARIDAAGDPVHCVTARTHIAAMMGSVHLFDQARAYVEDALLLAADNQQLRRSALLIEAELSQKRGQFGRALECFEKVVAMGPLEREQAYRLEIGLAHTLAASGDRKKGLAHLQKGTELADPKDMPAAIEREKIRGLILHFTRDFHGAVQAFERVLDLARAAGLSYEVAIGQHNLGDSLIWLGSFGRAHVAFRESLALCEEYGYERLATHDHMYIAFLEGEMGRVEAADTLNALIVQAEAHGFTWDVLDGLYLLGLLAFRQGREHLARVELTRVRELACEHHNHLLEQGALDMLEQLPPPSAPPSSRR